MGHSLSHVCGLGVTELWLLTAELNIWILLSRHILTVYGANGPSDDI